MCFNCVELPAGPCGKTCGQEPKELSCCPCERAKLMRHCCALMDKIIKRHKLSTIIW